MAPSQQARHLVPHLPPHFKLTQLHHQTCSSANSPTVNHRRRPQSVHPLNTPPPLPQVHSRGKSLGKDVDLEKIARRTPGFTGADLQNLMNEAAILAARRNLKELSKEEIADALERIIAGPEKKNSVLTEKKKKLVAYHEVGLLLLRCEGAWGGWQGTGAVCGRSRGMLPI
jgi:hypothetical protein